MRESVERVDRNDSADYVESVGCDVKAGSHKVHFLLSRRLDQRLCIFLISQDHPLRSIEICLNCTLTRDTLLFYPYSARVTTSMEPIIKDKTIS